MSNIEDKNIIGYQYSPVNNIYIGEYVFENNMDRDEIHIPPFTTLIAPPKSIPENSSVFFENGDWVVKENVVSNYVPVIEDYAMVTDSFVQYLISNGMWTEDDELKRKEAIELMNSQIIKQETTEV